MKRIIIALLILLAIVASFQIGRTAGIRHAIQDSEIWLSEYTEPDAGGDWIINLDLDGHTYQNTLWIY